MALSIWKCKYYLLVVFAFGCTIYLSILVTLPHYQYVIAKLSPIYQEAHNDRQSADIRDTRVHRVGRLETNTTEEEENITVETMKPELKYILQWTPAKTVPFEYMGVGQQGFIDRNCPYTNCYVTNDRNYLKDYTHFDVIAFSGPQVRTYFKNQLPQKRSLHQKFVFASIESSAYYPVCNEYFDGFFNWTWTFKTDSDSRWGYLVVRDMEAKVLGPNTVMHWMKHEDMLPPTDELKTVLRGKKKTAAWFVSNCVTPSKREHFATKLNKELQSKYNLTVDIYGRCGNFKCVDDEVCNAMIRKDYYFYLSFENSFSDDYVTEKLTRALENNAIPIVYGGANYSRFMPEGAYLDARDLGVEKLAAMMNDLINDSSQYADYFRWTNHYRYQRRDATVDTNDYCAMCTILNDEDKVKKVSIYQDFRKWWNNPNSCR